MKSKILPLGVSNVAQGTNQNKGKVALFLILASLAFARLLRRAKVASRRRPRGGAIGRQKENQKNRLFTKSAQSGAQTTI